ncbi:PRC-barrel domain-containing protein [Paraburkholderia sediminicola]|uniref:PRC-barrel domain-containing protein n=2 Tax=Paraburkholderia sediminicola TaxID=458836 RepID=UPI0038B8CAD0
MLRSIQDMFGCSVTCPDGELGKVDQIYFDVHSWRARYLVVDTSAWGYGQKIWVPPCCIHQIDFDSSVVKLNLEQQKMLGSPAIDTLKPISRFQEAKLVNYYGCKPYWEEAHANGASQCRPGVINPAAVVEPETRERMTLHTNAVNIKVHLLSTKQAGGYTIEAVDGPIGQIRDFVFDDETWQIRYLTIDTHGWWQSKSEVLLSTESVDSIDSAASTISTTLSREAIQQSPVYLDDVPLRRMYETQLHKA